MRSRKTAMEDLEVLLLTLIYKVTSLQKHRRNGKREAKVPETPGINGDVISVVKSAVCEVYKISPEELGEKRRTKDIVDPRTIGMGLSWRFHGGTMTEIGKSFGCKDHGAVIGARDRIIDMCEVDRKFREKCEACEDLVKKKLYTPELDYQI